MEKIYSEYLKYGCKKKTKKFQNQTTFINIFSAHET